VRRGRFSMRCVRACISSKPSLSPARLPSRPLALSRSEASVFAWSGPRRRSSPHIDKAHLKSPIPKQQVINNIDLIVKTLLLCYCDQSMKRNTTCQLHRLVISQCVRAAVVHGDKNLLPARQPKPGHPGLDLRVHRQLHGLI
jgi:hypothetical protein